MPPNAGINRLLLTLPLVMSLTWSTWPLLPTKVPLDRMQLVQLGRPRLSAEVTSLVLKPCQLLWLRMFSASAWSSSFTLSARAIRNDFFSDMSSRANGLPRPASLSRLPLTNWKSTTSPLKESIEPLPLALPGAKKVFTMEAHCDGVNPAVPQAVSDAGLPLNSVLEPKAEAMPATERVPSGSTFGRCWVSLPAPKNLPFVKPAVPVEKG